MSSPLTQPFLSTLLITSSILTPLQAQAQTKSSCKSTPASPDWPTDAQWSSLNTTLAGRLLHPSPPASACHANYPDFDNGTCVDVTKAWTDFSFHQNDPVSTAWNNMNNDTCLPDLAGLGSVASCSGTGYPVYVVNASCAEDVKAAVDFARQNNLRLNVKASGHDYLKRTSAPYSLSIWTRYLVGDYEFHDGFTPAGCNITIDTTAVTAGAGSYVSDIYYSLNLQNQTAIDGMGKEVTMGGYLTGGGHSPLSHMYGVGADQVYEVEMVTPMGEIITANECQNEDLFWAVRGGGGGTFGILTKVTIRTIPAYPIAVYDFKLEAASNSTVWWEIMAYVFAQLPGLSNANVSAFTYLYPNTTSSLSPSRGPVAAFEGVFALPEPSSPDALIDLWTPIWQHINETWPGQVNTSATPVVFPNLYALYQKFADNSPAGVDKVVGSRLLPPETLTDDRLTAALMTFLGDAPDGGRLYMVSGKGVWDAQPRGGGDAVNPAWRQALIHAVTSKSWTPLNATEQAAAEYSVNHVQVEALRQLAPNSGAYLNEAYWDEPNFQQAFWGSNYERLSQIKEAVDPDGLLWCHTCVGSEAWAMDGDVLCPVE